MDGCPGAIYSYAYIPIYKFLKYRNMYLGTCIYAYSPEIYDTRLYFRRMRRGPARYRRPLMTAALHQRAAMAAIITGRGHPQTVGPICTPTTEFRRAPLRGRLAALAAFGPNIQPLRAALHRRNIQPLKRAHRRPPSPGGNKAAGRPAGGAAAPPPCRARAVAPREPVPACTPNNQRLRCTNKQQACHLQLPGPVFRQLRGVAATPRRGGDAPRHSAAPSHAMAALA